MWRKITQAQANFLWENFQRIAAYIDMENLEIDITGLRQAREVADKKYDLAVDEYEAIYGFQLEEVRQGCFCMVCFSRFEEGHCPICMPCCGKEGQKTC